MVATPIRQNDLAAQAIEGLKEQLLVTEAVLLKILEKVGTVTVTAEELKKDVSDNVIIDMDFDEKSQVWTFSLKEETPEG
jgi:hypothetical protein